MPRASICSHSLGKAAVFEREGSFVLKDVPVPQIEAEDQVIVEVEACSICGTDVHITATYLANAPS